MAKKKAARSRPKTKEAERKRTTNRKAARRKAAPVKTAKNAASVEDFVSTLDDLRRADCQKLVQWMAEITGQPPAMWGASIVGFGTYHYRYASGREGDWFETGFSPRKQNLTLYIMGGLEAGGALLEKLGPYKHGKSCLYIKNLDAVHIPTLKKLIRLSVAQARKNHRPVD